jgi:hypothetical protein
MMIFLGVEGRYRRTTDILDDYFQSSLKFPELEIRDFSLHLF